MTKLTADEIIAAGRAWKEWGGQFGWEVFGMNGNDDAGFHRLADGANGLPFTITKAMREDIDRVLLNAMQTSD